MLSSLQKEFYSVMDPIFSNKHTIYAMMQDVEDEVLKYMISFVKNCDKTGSEIIDEFFEKFVEPDND